MGKAIRYFTDRPSVDVLGHFYFFKTVLNELEGRPVHYNPDLRILVHDFSWGRRDLNPGLTLFTLAG